MAIQGLRTTANFVADQRPKNWREGMLLLYPNGKLPLTGLTSLMKKRSTDDPEFNWWEKPMQTRRLQLVSSSTALTTSNTSVSLEATQTGTQLKEGDILLVEQSGEQLRIASDPTSDTSIIVTRGWAGTTPTAVNTTTSGVNPNMVVIGSVYEEGSLPPSGVNFDPTKKYNYTQIFRNTLEITRTASKTRLRTGDAVKEAKRECLEIHGVDMERAFFLGGRSETTINGKPARSTGGLKYLLDNYNSGSNVKDANVDYSTGLTMAGLEEYMFNIFKFGSSEKVAFLGNRALLTINQCVRKNAHFNIQSGIKEYGMDVTRVFCPFCTLVLKTHPLFNQITGGTNTTAYYGMESWMFVMDMDNIKYVYLDGSDTNYQPVLQANGLDGMQSGYLTECGLEISLPQTHYLIKNLVLAKAD